jgi:hypothetical protein
MLELTPKFGREHYTISRHGEMITELRLSWFREAGEVTIDGVPHTLGREGLLSRDFTLSRGDEVIARAHKPSMLRDRLEVEHAGRTYELARASMWRSDLHVRADGQTLGSIRRTSAFSRHAVVDLPDDWDLPLQVFLAGLAVLLWNRDDSSGGAVGAGA